MTQDIDAVLTQRGSQYGDFSSHAQITQDIKDIMRASVSWSKMNQEQREALDMVAHKIGRVCNGNPYYKDSWTDIIGYARLVEKTLPEPAAGIGSTVAVNIVLPENRAK